MKNKLKSLFDKILKVEGKIKFALTYIHKGCIVELEIGNKKNKECGPIYSELEDWLSYGEFMDYLISHNVFHNLSGVFYQKKQELYAEITIIGSSYSSFENGEDVKYIYLSKEFIETMLKINFNEIGMLEYDKENFRLSFHKIKNLPIERLELLYFVEEWKKYRLDNNQYKILEDYVDSIILNSTPTFDIDFKHELIWEVNCDDWFLDYNYFSTPIKIKLNEVIS